jgi:hypothetical protein
MIGGSSPGGDWEFFSSPPRPDRCWGPPSLLSNGVPGTLSLGVKRPGRGALSHNTLSRRDAQLKHKNNFTFAF